MQLCFSVFRGKVCIFVDTAEPKAVSSAAIFQVPEPPPHPAASWTLIFIFFFYLRVSNCGEVYYNATTHLALKRKGKVGCGASTLLPEYTPLSVWLKMEKRGGKICHLAKACRENPTYQGDKNAIFGRTNCACLSPPTGTEARSGST